MDLQSGLERAWTNIATFVPNLVAFLLILVVGYFVAKAIGKVVDTVLERVGFDRAVERGGIQQAMARSKYDASDIVSKLVFYTLFLFVLQLAFGVFGPNPVSDLLTDVIAFLPNVFIAIVAALNQIGVAQFITQAITTALLVALVGTIIVGVGGGLVKPMQSRWERILDRASDEAQNARQQVQTNRSTDPYPAYDDAPDGSRAASTTTAVYRPSGSGR